MAAGSEADLDNMLIDLSSVIADLEAFTVVCEAVCCAIGDFVNMCLWCGQCP